MTGAAPGIAVGSMPCICFAPAAAHAAVLALVLAHAPAAAIAFGAVSVPAAIVRLLLLRMLL